MNSQEISNLKKINKTQAKKYFNGGQEIYLFPCKANLNSTWIHPVTIDNKDTNDYLFDNICSYFDSLINNFEYYNCNNELGKHTAFYINIKACTQ